MSLEELHDLSFAASHPREMSVLQLNQKIRRLLTKKPIGPTEGRKFGSLQV
jgi:hypothetical protein